MIRGLGRLISMVMAVSLLAVAPWRIAPAHAEEAPLRIGLLPTIATLSLLRLYDPLRQHLQQSLGRRVELYTSGNFHSYLADIQAEEFDVLVAAPHFGVIAYERGYVPLYRYRQVLIPLIVVPKGSDLREARQLRGRRILTGDRLTANSVVVETWLRTDFGMVAGVDYTLVDAANHATAMRAVAIGDADAAIGSSTVLRQIPEDLRSRLASFPSRLHVPHQFIMAHARLGAETVRAIRDALGRLGETEPGKAFFAAGGFKGLEPITADDIEQVRPYAELVSNRIRSGN